MPNKYAFASSIRRRDAPYQMSVSKLTCWGGAGLRPGEPVEGSRRSNTTDKNGNATFSITLQHPYLVASFQQKCASEVSFSIETILTQGIVAKNHCWHKNSELNNLRPHPGELVLFFDKLNVFEKWKHIRDAPGIP